MRTYVLDVAAGGRLDLIDEIAHPDMVDVGVVDAGGPTGSDGLRLHVSAAHKAMEDRSAEIRRLVATEDEVMAWWTMTGRHSAPWLGVEPTGRSVTATAFSFFRLRDGRIEEYEYWVDLLGVLQQLEGDSPLERSHIINEVEVDSV
jgi:steroid delta-isomerase-like uncharacterized protein